MVIMDIRLSDGKGVPQGRTTRAAVGPGGADPDLDLGRQDNGVGGPFSAWARVFMAAGNLTDPINDPNLSGDGCGPWPAIDPGSVDSRENRRVEGLFQRVGHGLGSQEVSVEAGPIAIATVREAIAPSRSVRHLRPRRTNRGVELAAARS